jgi:hypothetical protein
MGKHSMVKKTGAYDDERRCRASCGIAVVKTLKSGESMLEAFVGGTVADVILTP